MNKSRYTSLHFKCFLQALLLIISILQVHAFSQQAPNPRHNNNNNIQQKNDIVTFEQFEFAPNGVCIQPQYFIDTSDSSSNPNQPKRFTMRNVPGTGDCMFQAVVLASLTSMGLGGNDVLLRAISRETRAVVAQILQSDGNLNIEGNRLVPATDLLKSAARQEGFKSTDQYLKKLLLEGRDGGLYGGGPELAVLSNILRRPISVYEFDPEQPSTNKDHFAIQCKGVFGDRFADPCASIPDSAVLSGSPPGAYSWHLHVLVLDVPSTGDKHACVLLPQQDSTNENDSRNATSTNGARKGEGKHSNNQDVNGKDG